MSEYKITFCRSYVCFQTSKTVLQNVRNISKKITLNNWRQKHKIKLSFQQSTIEQLRLYGCFEGKYTPFLTRRIARSICDLGETLAATSLRVSSKSQSTPRIYWRGACFTSNCFPEYFLSIVLRLHWKVSFIFCKRHNFWLIGE